MLVQQDWAAYQRKTLISCCKRVFGEISTCHDIVNILLNNILKQRGLVSHEQKWEERKTVRTAHDEITVGTEHPRSDDWKDKVRVVGAKLKPKLAWLRREAGGQWKKVVVDVKVRSTDDMNKAFKEKDEKYRVWATQETREEKMVKAVMVPLIISHDGAIHKDTVR